MKYFTRHSTQLLYCLFFFSPVVSLGLSSPSYANQIYIPVGEPRVKKSILAFPKIFAETGISVQATDLHTMLKNDLLFSNLFSIQSEEAFIEKMEPPSGGLSLDTFHLSDWSTIGSEFLIRSRLSISGGDLTYELVLFDVLGGKQILGKKYLAKTSDFKTTAHTAANDILEVLTGHPGPFLSKIVMVCDKSSFKEIWMTDFDGSNPKQITNHKTLSFAPAWSPDNRRIAYSVYTRSKNNVKNIDLYELDLATGASKLLSNRRGINSGAVYSPDGKAIALTMSFLGNPEIFLLNPRNREATRITKSWGFDVDPAFSPDGKQLAFASSRSNQPMIYISNIEELKKDPSQAVRKTFAGKYNATPSWSPDGKRFVFAGFNDSHFDLFLMDATGTNLERLTGDEGNNEDPHFSPDGNFIAFSSNRAGGQKNIYLITMDGKITRRITHGLGNCVAPKWSFGAVQGFGKGPSSPMDPHVQK